MKNSSAVKRFACVLIVALPAILPFASWWLGGWNETVYLYRKFRNIQRLTAKR